MLLGGWAVLRQPRYEIFEMFHDVLLLGTGGVTVYLGPATRALAYFEQLGYQCPARTNPADLLMYAACPPLLLLLLLLLPASTGPHSSQLRQWLVPTPHSCCWRGRGGCWLPALIPTPIIAAADGRDRPLASCRPPPLAVC